MGPRGNCFRQFWKPPPVRAAPVGLWPPMNQRSRRETLRPERQCLSIRQVEQFYARTVDAVEDLREHIYREAARLLVALHWLPDEVRNAPLFLPAP